MAFTIAYCEEVTKAGMDIDEFAPRLSFFFISHQDFFEQICKFRAARPRLCQDHVGALRRTQTGNPCVCACMCRPLP